MATSVLLDPARADKLRASVPRSVHLFGIVSHIFLHFDFIISRLSDTRSCVL